MKIILGINAYHADSSACILINGKIVAAIEEERINRKKHFSGFPTESIKECLKIANLNSEQINDVAFNTSPFKNFFSKIFFLIKNLKIQNNNFIKRFDKKINVKKKLVDTFKLNKDIKFHYIEHHLAHIASAFYASGIEKAYGLSIDGSGDFVTFALSQCNRNKIKLIKKIFFPNSLGIFYHAMTQFLNFNNYGDEYKVMGMAAYGSPKYFNKIKDNLFIENNNDEFKLNLKYFNHHKHDFKYIAGENLEIDRIYNDELVNLFNDDFNNPSENDSFSKNFAASVQKVYEYFFEIILKNINLKNYSKNIVFAGGCALNSSANRFITNSNLFDEKYIPFAPGDNGGALGAALSVAARYHKRLDNTKTPFLGKQFSNNEINKILESKFYINKVKYELLKSEEDLLQIATKLISDGKVIGWFQGKMEFGPRALGNRSIIADPRNPEMKSIINKKIKRRESFRPFAPSVLEEYQSEWFECSFKNPYMSSLSNVKKDKQRLVPAITHVDGTARLQTVSKNSNLRFYNLINCFNKLTKVPILLNTSFNENEPIVMKPEEALDCLLRTDMDALFLNDFFVEKI